MITGKVRRTAGLLAGALLVMGGTLAGAIRGGAIVPVLASLRDPQSLFAERSPGGRVGGVLANTKSAYATGNGADDRRGDVAILGNNPAFVLVV